MYPLKKLTAAVLFISVLVMQGCKNKSYPDKPEDVLTEYLETATQNDVTASLKYVTKDSEPILKMLEKNTNPHDTVNRGTIKDMHIGKASVNGNKAILSSYNKVNNIISYFILFKENEKWKVSLNRESMIETTKLVFTHYGINVDDFQSGKIDKDSAKKIMENYQLLHPNGE